MKVNIYHDDILEWSRIYEGPPFQALFSDPPYHLASISKRFGKKGSKPSGYGKDGAFNRVAKGFMEKEWDTDVAFEPETWEAIGKHMLPGAFGLLFMGSRTYHKAAVAVEDAGFIIHPMIGWIQSQGFPKATRIDTQIDRKLGKERKVIGKMQNPGSTNPRISMHDGWQSDPDITEPASPMAKIWKGHRYGLQSLKPCLEPIIMFQKPYEGKPIDCIVNTGAGSINVEGTKFSKDREFMINRFDDGMKPFGHGAGHAYTSEKNTMLYPANVLLYEFDEEPFRNFFYNAKASKKEKNLGLTEDNKHPTIKPISLNTYLASMLLPPEEYAPRRILVPFSGTGSEVIGAKLAGWEEVVGVELEEESVNVSKQRIEYWLNGK